MVEDYSDKKSKKYSLFNGRRSADEYVKGYLKAVVVISSTGLGILLTVGGWVLLQVIDLQSRVNVIESNRYTVDMSMEVNERVQVNSKNFAVIDTKLSGLTEDMREIKTLLRRAAPFEIRKT